MKKYIILPMTGLFCGTVFGLLGAFLDHYSNGLPMPDYDEDHWWLLLMLPSLPGFFTVPFWYPAWDGGDTWDYRWNIAICNGFFWMLISLAFPMMLDLAKFSWQRLKSAYQKRSFLIKLAIHDCSKRRL